jgi:hypothetical protein
VNPSHPPRLAVWLLKHFGPESNQEALTGDLQEAFSLGKSKTWYWRQVLRAIAWRGHVSVILIAVACSWFMSWLPNLMESHTGSNVSFNHLLYVVTFTPLFLALHYLPKILEGKLGTWLHRALVMFLFLYCPLGLVFVLFSVLHRKMLSSQYPGTEQQRLMENLHRSLLQETDPKLRTAYEQAITKLKSNQKPDSIPPIA